MVSNKKNKQILLYKFTCVMYIILFFSYASANFDKNAIVKITNEGKIHNVCEPYKMPENQSCVGSGFFSRVNGQLCILTNYHVIEEAKRLSINIPNLGKQKFEIDMSNIGCYPERDVALIRLKEKELEKLKTKMGEIPFLELDDSDKLEDSEGLTIAGWPLNSDSIQLSEGIFAGKDTDQFYNQTLHTTAPINPGNSGGPALNDEGQVVGICVSKIYSAEGMGYLIPINEVKNILPYLLECQKIRFPFWGAIVPNKITEDTLKYFANDETFDKGVYIQNILPGSLCEKYGIKKGDILYKINNIEIDIHGYIESPEEKENTHFFTYLNKIPFWQNFTATVLRDGQELTIEATKEPGNNFNSLKKILTEFESMDYEIINGMIIMPIKANHLEINEILRSLRMDLNEFFIKSFQQMLIITAVLPESECYDTSFIKQSIALSKINGNEVKTLEELRAILKNSIANNDKYVVFENRLGGIIAIPTEKIVESYKELQDLNINFKSPIFEEQISS